MTGINVQLEITFRNLATSDVQVSLPTLFQFIQPQFYLVPICAVDTAVQETDKRACGGLRMVVTLK